MNDIVVKKTESAQSISVVHDMVNLIAGMAVNSDVDADKFEKLMNIQLKMMDKQAEIDFNQDFISMQSELPIIAQKGEIKTKEKDGGGYRVTSRYSRFEDIMEAINPILHKYGFSFRHTTRPVDNTRIEIVSVLLHKSGHSQSTSFISPMDKENALKSGMQAAKSTVSFGKRTNIISCLNLSEVSEDSDFYKNQVISVEQAEELERLITATNSDRDKFLALCGVDNLLDVTIARYKWAKNVLDGKVKQLGDSI